MKQDSERQIGLDTESLEGRSADLPKSAELVSAFREAETRGSCPVTTMASALAAHHLRQWAAEDVSRQAADPHAKANAKQTIDELNAIRVGMVERLDMWAARILPADPDGALHTETLGSVIDRLAIAWVRYQNLVDNPDDPDRSMARAALRQLSELADAYDDLVRDVMDGVRRIPVWRPLKRYGTSR